eukprot:scaffold8055_cov156-Cylindrotheca_fusiformis.AAC.2
MLPSKGGIRSGWATHVVKDILSEAILMSMRNRHRVGLLSKSSTSKFSTPIQEASDYRAWHFCDILVPTPLSVTISRLQNQELVAVTFATDRVCRDPLANAIRPRMHRTIRKILCILFDGKPGVCSTDSDIVVPVLCRRFAIQSELSRFMIFRLVLSCRIRLSLQRNPLESAASSIRPRDHVQDSCQLLRELMNGGRMRRVRRTTVHTYLDTGHGGYDTRCEGV